MSRGVTGIGIGMAVMCGMTLGALTGVARGQCLSGEVPAGDANRIYTGVDEGDRFGIGVAGIGDILGFPTEEAAIIAKEGNSSSDPQVYVVHQSFSNPFFYQLPFSETARAVSPAGDVDGDGTLDWIVGGHTTKVYSGATGSVIASYQGENTADEFGNSLAALGDLDGDGLDDLAVGAWKNDVGNGCWECGLVAHAGRVYVFLSGSQICPSQDPRPATCADLIFTGNPGDWLGTDIAAGDVNGDGMNDLIMTAFYARYDDPFGDPPPSDCDPGPPCTATADGKTYVYFFCPDFQPPGQTVEFGAGEDPLDPEMNAVIVMDESQTSPYFGWAATAGRDLADSTSGTGIEDFAIGTYRWVHGGEDAGKVHVFHGEQLTSAGAACGDPVVVIGSSTAKAHIVGEQEASSSGGAEGSISLGWDLAFANVDGDNFVDLIIGAPYYDEGAIEIAPGFFVPEFVDIGEGYVFYGPVTSTFNNPLTAEDADISFLGTNEGDLFAYSVDNHGFANRDSQEDLIFGAPYLDDLNDPSDPDDDEANVGRAYVFFVCPDP